MKISPLSAMGLLLLAGPLHSEKRPKTTFPVRVDSSMMSEKPYRYNGVVLTENARGSGFCAWNQKTFFSAAHVVYEESGWVTPPEWYPAMHDSNIDGDDAILSRGYYRWSNYSKLVDPDEDLEINPEAGFSRDVILGFAFTDLIPEKPAKLERNGEKKLKKRVKTLITGYPTENAYFDEKIDGYYLHQTGPVKTRYKSYDGTALQTTLVTTGKGNSGGPIWTKGKNKKWKAAGVLVGGLPSETIVYAFSNDVNALIRSVKSVVQKKIKKPKIKRGVRATSRLFPYNRTKKIPDGLHRWTNIPFQVGGFDEDATVTQVHLSFEITTPHRGDLLIILSAPSGESLELHKEQGSRKNNLVFRQRDLSANFAEISENFDEINANGRWNLRIQDRLKGDLAELQSAILEISVDEDPPVVKP